MSRKTSKQPIRNLKRTVLSDDWAVLSRYEFDYRHSDGGWEDQDREVYHRGDAVAVLPFDAARGTILLLRQFRLAAWLVGGEEAIVEACAGIMDDGEDAATAASREALEELGYRLQDLKPAFTGYSSPGSVTERVFCFTASYSEADRIGAGGGKADEGEDIEIIEMKLDDALAQIGSTGIFDMKTVALLQHLKLSVA